MNKYEWIDELSRYMQKHHSLVITIDRYGFVSASFPKPREHFVGYISGGQHKTAGKEGDEFKQSTYNFLNWVLGEENKNKI